MNRLIKSLALVVIACVSLCVFFACGNTGGNEGGNADKVVREEAKGLEFSFNDNNTCTLTGIGTCRETDLVIPAEVNGHTVTAIGEAAFMYSKQIKSLVIPKTVTFIDRFAFAVCKFLTEIDYLGTLDDWVQIEFADGSNPLASAGVLKINGVTVTKAKIEKATKISDSAFAGCTTLTQIEIGESVTSIGKNAFDSCTSLNLVELPNTITEIADYTFFNCRALAQIDIGDSVTSIGSYAFYHCEALKEVVIGKGITKIDYSAFLYDNSLSKIYYKGTSSQWAKIANWSSDNPLSLAKLYYYSENRPSGSGNYWYYDKNGNVAEW